MAEYIPDNDVYMQPYIPDNCSPNPQPESMVEPGYPSQQSMQTMNLKDDYELLETLGKGGFGTVKKAKHRRTEEIIAVKIIKSEPGEDFSKLQNEISMMKSVLHPNIVAYLGSYLSNDKLWICMEYCGGKSLQDNYRDSGSLPELQVAYVCRETLKGLEYLHSKRIIHRDIKGANILLTTDGNVKLADFGVSAKLTETTSKRETSMIGTFDWMAPEVRIAGKNRGYNEKCDIYSLGITSIELATCKTCDMEAEDRKNCSTKFKDFMKVCLYRRPTKRPSANSLLLQHPFVTQYLPEDTGKALLHRSNIAAWLKTFMYSPLKKNKIEIAA